jgi:phospholipid/cholesterol/gamma-HCH transport system substrate-binding protein
MRSFSRIGRIAALGAVSAAAVLVAVVLFGGGSRGYEVKARFLNAGQLVKGNPVQNGGVPIGSVTEIAIAPDGQAEITLEIDGDHAPLRRGTQAAIRQLSQSGIANRYRCSRSCTPSSRS